MNPGVAVYLNLAPFVGFLTTGVWIYSWRFRRGPAVPSLLWYTAVTLWVLFTNILELLAPVGPATLFWAHAQYLGFVYLPVAWGSFALRYTGLIQRHNPLVVGLVIILPLLVWVTTLLAPEFLWSDYRFVEWGPYSVIRPSHGPLYWLIFLYSWAAMFSGTVMLVVAFFRGVGVFSRQTAMFTIGVLLPGLFNIMNVFRLIPGLEKDFTPLGYTLSALCFLLALLWYRAGWIMPVARTVLVERISLPLLVLDARGLVLDCNPALRRRFQWQKEPIGQVLTSHPVLGVIPGWLEDSRDWTRTLRDQEGRLWEGSIHPVGDPAYAWLVLLSDITDTAHLRQEVESMKEQFILREKQATIGRLAAGTAHEINNPLAYLQSNVKSLRMIAQGGNPEDLPEIIQVTHIIEGGLARIGAAAQALMNYARNTRVDSPRSVFDLHEMIDATVEFMHYAQRGRVRLERYYGTIPSLEGHPEELSQVLFNLLSNAEQAISGSGKADGLITVRTSQENGMAVIRVENNGPPIPASQQERIFELFYSSRSDRPGTGLGLNISREIVEIRHRGRLELESCDPVRFAISLPLTQTLNRETT